MLALSPCAPAAQSRSALSRIALSASDGFRFCPDPEPCFAPRTALSLAPDITFPDSRDVLPLLSIALAPGRFDSGTPSVALTLRPSDRMTPSTAPTWSPFTPSTSLALHFRLGHCFGVTPVFLGIHCHPHPHSHTSLVTVYTDFIVTMYTICVLCQLLFCTLSTILFFSIPM